MSAVDVTAGVRGARSKKRGRGRSVRSSVANALGRSLIVSSIVLILSFLLVRLVPGDPVTAAGGARATPEAREQMREQLGLTGSLPSQFLDYIGGVVRGDLGTSVAQQGRSVADIIGATLPVTLSLVVVTMLLSLLVGVPFGILAALRGGAADVAVRSSVMVLLATPPFFLGLLLLLIVSIKLGLLPAGGWGSSWAGSFQYLILPAIALAGFMVPLIVRTTRQAASEVIGERWAEALITRGISRRRLALAHVLPNALLPTITLVGLNVGALMAGAVVVESVFALPGIGEQLVNAVNLRDYPVVQGIALVSAIVVVASNLAADVVYALVDPRTRS